MGINNSKGSKAQCVLQGSFSPGTTDLGCFCACAQAMARVAVAGPRSRGDVASPSSAPHLANDTGDIAGVTFKYHRCGWSCQTTGLMRSHEIFKEKGRIWALRTT